MKVTKRNGVVENFDIDKIHRVLEWAVGDITGVSVSDIEMNAQLNLYDKISTTEIHKVLIRSAGDLISEESPNYQYVAAKLLLFHLRKEVWGDCDPPRFLDHIKHCVAMGVYDGDILNKYTESEIHKLGKYLKHNRDDKFTYSGLQQMVDKYLVKNRKTNEIYETPQFAYMMVPMTLFSDYPEETRFEYIKQAYDFISQFKINLPTPILAGVRTPIRQYSSCILIDVGDSLPSIASSTSAIFYYTAKRAGIGLNVGRIRPIGSEIRGGEVIHTGLLPYLKVFEKACKSTTQNGIRGGSATVTVPFWHYEIEDVVVLKNNAGTDDNRVRQLDYCIAFSRLFYERVKKDEYITLFSPHECQDLYEAFGQPEFDALYEEYERKRSLKFKKKIKARDFISLFSKERLETARIYIMHIDHVNQHGAWLDGTYMTNLCVEITQPTKPIEHIDDPDGEIGVCTLAAGNLGEMKLEEIPDVAKIIVRMLDALIDYQDYPVEAAKIFARLRRSLGIGFTNFAGWLAKNKIRYTDPEALIKTDEIAELWQFSLLRASCDLAKEKGPCQKYDRTKYSQGILPIDTYNRNVDGICSRPLTCDWDGLRADIKQYGLRNSTLTAQMPCESSSVVQNSTNGIEPVRGFITQKVSKMGALTQIVPGFSKFRSYYTNAFEPGLNPHLTNIAAIITKYFDMAISLNHYYDYKNYPGGDIPRSELVKEHMYLYKMGVKTLYYTNSLEEDTESDDSGCAGGACSI